MEALDINEVFSEDFLKKSFPEKRHILKEFLLEEIVEKHIQEKINKMKISSSYSEQVDTLRQNTLREYVDKMALCYEDRQQDSEGSGYRWFLSGNDTSQKLKSITSNRFYKILDINYNSQTDDMVIKISSDTGRKSWVMANRFLFGDAVLRRLRAEKLKNLF